MTPGSAVMVLLPLDNHRPLKIARALKRQPSHGTNTPPARVGCIQQGDIQIPDRLEIDQALMAKDLLPFGM
jgi:hypothetical protein